MRLCTPIMSDMTCDQVREGEQCRICERGDVQCNHGLVVSQVPAKLHRLSHPCVKIPERIRPLMQRRGRACASGQLPHTGLFLDANAKLFLRVADC